MSRVLSAIIAAVLFGALIKVSLEPNKTTAKYYDRKIESNFGELDRALRSNAESYPATLLPKP
jgi:hypothetical protein